MTSLKAVRAIYGNDTAERVRTAHVLLVGAGGIGCEVLKNLVLAGFRRITVIDLDTIEVSNLNRQFLFRKVHVGQSKAVVAREAVLRFLHKRDASAEVEIDARHDTIFNAEYDVDFYRKFDIVLNALDNRAARNHVNRMCLAADRCLLDSGTNGYLGQCDVIRKGETECYECRPKSSQRTYPACTIRNTPSEPVHCIIWAKFLFNQLFGEADPEEDVSPDSNDPELQRTAETGAATTTSEDDKRPSADGEGSASGNGSAHGEEAPMTTRKWAEQVGYEPELLLRKLFVDDIRYLLRMESLWKTRRAPVCVDELCTLQSASDSHPQNGAAQPGTAAAEVDDEPESSVSANSVWSVAHAVRVFRESVAALRDRRANSGADATLSFDKDDDVSMRFVAAASNLRAACFSIERKSFFETKSIAGNIVPAIATTNAIIAGAMLIEALKFLAARLNEMRAVMLRQVSVGTALYVASLQKPNATCYVCAAEPMVFVEANFSRLSLRTVQDLLLKRDLGMQAPDVTVDGRGVVLISSEPGETDANLPKTLADFQLASGVRLKCDDFFQNYTLSLIFKQVESLVNDTGEELEYLIVSRPPDSELKEKITQDETTSANQAAAPSATAEVQQVNADAEGLKDTSGAGAQLFANAGRKRKHEAIDANDEDDIVMLD